METADGVIADRIEREILIDAPIDRVWELVSQPGWWIGDGDRSGHVVTREGDLVVVDDPRYGRFPLLPVAADAPHHVAFRGSAEVNQVPGEGTSTLVEFFLTETPGGTLLRVVESGFASLTMPAAQRAEAVEGNTRGWELQLAIAERETGRGTA